VSGVRIAGVPVSVTQDGIAAGAATVPLTADPALTAALAQAGLTVELVAARPVDKGAIAPAVRITTPVPTPGFGDGTGKMILVLGGASAAFSSFVPPLPDTVPGVTGPGGSDGSSSDSAVIPTGGAGTVPGAGSGLGAATLQPGTGTTSLPVPSANDAVSGATPSAPATGSTPAEVALRPGSRTAGTPALATRPLGEQFDIRDLYLAVAALGLVVLGMATLLRHLGVRSP